MILEKKIPFLMFFITTHDFQGRFRLSKTKYTKTLLLEIEFFPIIISCNEHLIISEQK